MPHIFSSVSCKSWPKKYMQCAAIDTHVFVFLQKYFGIGFSGPHRTLEVGIIPILVITIAFVVCTVLVFVVTMLASFDLIEQIHLNSRDEFVAILERPCALRIEAEILILFRDAGTFENLPTQSAETSAIKLDSPKTSRPMQAHNRAMHLGKFALLERALKDPLRSYSGQFSLTLAITLPRVGREKQFLVRIMLAPGYVVSALIPLLILAGALLDIVVVMRILNIAHAVQCLLVVLLTRKAFRRAAETLEGAIALSLKSAGGTDTARISTLRKLRHKLIATGHFLIASTFSPEPGAREARDREIGYREIGYRETAREAVINPNLHRAEQRSAEQRSAEQGRRAAQGGAEKGRAGPQRAQQTARAREPAEMVRLTVDGDEHWVVASDGDQTIRAKAEYSKSSRAKCRFCCEKILKDTLRVGRPVKWADWITSWRHPDCFYVEDGLGPIADSEAFGMDKLKEEDKAAARVALARLKPPVVDESLNPDNPDFVKHTVAAGKADTPTRMTTKLLPFQQEGLRWLLDQEASEVAGGLLCDEMGMGKTIQTLSLIVASKFGERDADAGGDKALHVKPGPTLVIAPSSAMLQWKDEIENVTRENTLSVLVYYGAARGTLTPADLRKHDVILTSYPILEYEYRKCVDRCKVECKYCQRRFLPRKLIVHNQYFCGPNSKRTAKLALRDKKETAAKKQQAMDKAMATLNIINKGANVAEEDTGEANDAAASKKTRSSARKHSLPTMSNIYRDLMKEAKREPTGFYVSKEEARKQAAEAAAKASAPVADGDGPAIKTEVQETNDFDEPNVRERRNLWASDDGAAYFYKCKAKVWASNLGVSFNCLRTQPVVLEAAQRSGLTPNFRVKFLNGAGAAQLSIDGGETWVNWLAGRWITPRKGRLKKDEHQDGWQCSGPKMGALVSRVFDGKSIAAAVVAHAPASDDAGNENPALWRIEHTDGDEEDLEEAELSDAQKLFAQDFVASSAPKQATTSSVLLDAVAAMASETEVPGSSKAPKRASATAAAAQISKESEKTSKATTTNKRAVRKTRSKKKTNGAGDGDDDDDNDSDFEPKSSSDAQDDDDDDDIDDDVNDEEEAGKSTSKSKSKSKANDDDLASKIVDLRPCFRPVEWGPGSKEAKFLALFKSHFKASKGKYLEESSDESDFESSSDEEDEDAAATAAGVDLDIDIKEAKSRCEGDLFWFAAPGDVVDDDGIDMGSSILHCIGWNRIVLDEAHKIKDRVNSTAKATLALRGAPTRDLQERWPDGGPCYRWCLSGTPLQNRVGDLYSLVRFLRVEPYAFYMCKVSGCECRSLHWAMGRGGRVCDGCGHPPMRHFSYFNKVVVNPIKRNGYVGEGRVAMKLLRDDVLGKLMLRRTKKERQADIKLPPCSVEVRNLKFTEHERDFYESVYKNTRSKFDTYVGKGTVLHNYAHIFELLSRLRRAADHPYLVVHGAGDDPFGTSQAAGDRTKRTDICGICHFDIETLEEVAVSQCKHTFHRNCMDNYIAKYQGENDEDDDEDDEDGSDPVAEDSGLVLGHDGVTKEKKAKRRPPKKGRKSKTSKSKSPAAKVKSETPNCPLCYVPLSITLNLKGGTEGNQLSSTGMAGSAMEVGTSADEDLCVVCMDRQRDALLLPCGHIYLCMQCARGLDNRVCPMCRTSISRITRVDPNVDAPMKQAVVKEILDKEQQAAGETTSTHGVPKRKMAPPSAESDKILKTAQKASALIGRRSIMQRINTRKFSSSTKVEAVVNEVKNMMRDERKDTDELNKAIVFSQYNDMLDLIQWRLSSAGIVTVKLVGALSMVERRAVLEAFKTRDEVRVILLSLKAGGEGLNLTEASHVFLCDPWWNQAVSDQAIMRCHRIGQKRSVTAVHFVIKDSIEEKMMQLQEKKSLIFDGAVDGNTAAMTKLTEEDLRFLFSR
ncbi:DNA repair protein RAD16 [Hondaea fermentalgiana]|uniref:DNA repair protein RAD16 n=1 Tax=Hondaea fermentalgiana TaxID=2315210 RepID=A0A2R5G347_9STRA|nr:DNA repair protein RAD16 [Hondaea fermentalgiana]|eukprot:GBG24158.1 DNA repair protein RAD16 [Hondaea fermentalgiana]